MLTGLRILVVEDNLLNQKIVSFILQKQNAIIALAINGREAIDILLKDNYDIVLMDLQMPEMDGYSTIQYIRETMKDNIPIIALTAGLFADELEACERIGANACISKPIDQNGLCDLISNLTMEYKK